MAHLLLRGARAGAATSLRLATVSNAQTGATAAARCFATDATATKGGSSLPWILALGGGGAGLYFAKEAGYFDGIFGGASTPKIPSTKPPAKPDYGAVKAAISDLLDHDNYDDGSYGPIFVRLAWHASGTYDKNTNTGGSNGATMRFGEGEYAANAGLKVARDVLEPVKAKFPWISYADLWTLAGATAVEDMGGPEIKWRPGRTDALDGNNMPPDGRLPDGGKDAKHVRWVFEKMGFDDQEMVALSGAHALGRCHPDRSGWDGPWTNAPTTFSNEYFVQLFENKWTKKKWNGPLQYEDPSKQLMMLPTDLAIIWDKKFRKYAEEYYKDGEKFAADFAAAFSKLMELGVPYSDAGPGPYVAPPGERPKGETGHATH